MSKVVGAAVRSYFDEVARGDSDAILGQYRLLRKLFAAGKWDSTLANLYAAKTGKPPLATPQLVVATSSRVLPWGIGIYPGLKPPTTMPPHCVPVSCVEVCYILLAKPEDRLKMIDILIEQWESTHSGAVPADIEAIFRETGWSIEDGRMWSDEAGNSYWNCAMTLKRDRGLIAPGSSSTSSRTSAKSAGTPPKSVGSNQTLPF